MSVVQVLLPFTNHLAKVPTIRVVEESTTPSDDLENLVLYLPFDEGTGTTATDSSNHQNHGTLHKTNWTEGKYGKAIELSGKPGGWVEVPDSPSLDITDEITLMAWVHPTQFTQEWLRIIVKTWAGDTAPWMVYGLYQQGGSNGKVGFIVSVNGGREARCGNGPSPQLPLNTWTHLAATYDGTRMKLYYNGELKVETSATGKIDTNNVPLSIGKNSEGNREHYAGLIDEVAIWNTALDASEIRKAMNGGIAVEPDIAGSKSVAADINGDGVVNIQDLVLVSSNFGETGENPADVNKDGVVNIADLVMVAGELGNAAAAPSAWHDNLKVSLTRAKVEQWLTRAQVLDLTDATLQRGIRFLERLLLALPSKETALLPNYPNPFNPETWIPYQLSSPSDVTLTIYNVRGVVIRQLVLGYQSAGVYYSQSRAVYWDGRNQLGEPVASGIYFYTLTAGEFTATRKMLIRK